MMAVTVEVLHLRSLNNVTLQNFGSQRYLTMTADVNGTRRLSTTVLQEGFTDINTLFNFHQYAGPDDGPSDMAVVQHAHYNSYLITCSLMVLSFLPFQDGANIHPDCREFPATELPSPAETTNSDLRFFYVIPIAGTMRMVFKSTIGSTSYLSVNDDGKLTLKIHELDGNYPKDLQFTCRDSEGNMNKKRRRRAVLFKSNSSRKYARQLV